MAESPQGQKKSEVHKVPESPPPKKPASLQLAELEEEMNETRKTRTLTKIDLSILASLEQAKLLQKDLEDLQKGKVIVSL